MTNGDAGVTSGGGRWPAWAVAYVGIVIVTAVFGTVNALSVLDERAWIGRPIGWWEPVVWEASSGIVLIALAWMPLIMVLRFPPAGPGLLRNLLLHALGTVAFSLAHVGLMVALRHGAYALAGESYHFGGFDSFVYEYRKDIIPYLLYAGTFWLADRLMRPGAAPAVVPAVPVDVVIDEGQRLLRVPPRDVLCVRSSGNYAEFVLADGRRPLMRATLASLEESLAEAGFVRTHRSWLVNPAHVVEVAAEGSGDYGLGLSDGGKVPLSRRYPGALARLRGAP